MREVREKYVFVLAIIFVTASICSAANIVVNPGFETAETTQGGVPSSYGNWNGDYSAIVGTTLGINPLEGSQMLQFKGTSPSGASPTAIECVVWQLIDASPYHDIISAGNAQVVASALFNRVTGDSQTDTRSRVVIYTYSGSPSTFLSQLISGTFLDRIGAIIFADSDITTWELCQTEYLTLPTDTDFIALGILVDEDIYNDGVYPEFDGHFADAISLEIIAPKPMEVAVDIKPGSCPNPLNVKSKGVLPVAILGSEDFDVNTIDVASIRLAGVSPIRSSYEDVAGPVPDANDCNCIEVESDGFVDLTLKFKTQEIVEAIVEEVGEVGHNDILTLDLMGVLLDESPIIGSDCIVIRGKRKPMNIADINKDNIVDGVDFAIIAENWLQSSIFED